MNTRRKCKITLRFATCSSWIKTYINMTIFLCERCDMRYQEIKENVASVVLEVLSIENRHI